MKHVILIAISFFSIMATAKTANLAMADDVKITVLSDMVTSYLGMKQTRAEWGFAALVEVKENGQWKKLLFDTGSSPKVVQYNAKIMGIDLCEIEHVVLSHNHNDHTWGLSELRKGCLLKNSKAFKYAHAGSQEILWSRPLTDENGKVIGEDNIMVTEVPRYRSFGGKLLFDAGGKPTAIKGFSSLILTGSIPRQFNEKTFPPNQMMVNPKTGKMVQDTIPEDQALIINTAKGLIVVVGCAHAGTFNTLSYVTQLLSTNTVYAIIGGMHLFGKTEGAADDPGALSWLAQKLRGFKLQYILGAHCTGIEKVGFLRKALGLTDKTAAVSTIETRFELPNGIVLTDLNSSVDD